jgi:hypothetical protein
VRWVILQLPFICSRLLAADAQRIMGQANLEFAMGNFDKSKELCLRVVQVKIFMIFCLT